MLVSDIDVSAVDVDEGDMTSIWFAVSDAEGNATGIDDAVPFDLTNDVVLDTVTCFVVLENSTDGASVDNVVDGIALYNITGVATLDCRTSVFPLDDSLVVIIADDASNLLAVALGDTEVQLCSKINI